MRIVINATAAVAGGSITDIVNLLPALAELESEHEYLILLSRKQHRVHLDLPDSFRVQRVPFLTPSRLWRLLWEQTVLPLWLARVGADVLYATADLAPLLAPCPTVLAVRNLNPYYRLPSLRRRFRFALQRWMTRFSARKARKVIFNSRQSRHTIVPQLRIPYDRTEVVYQGMDHEVFDPGRSFSVQPDLGRRIEELRPFVLCVSTVNPHKNYETLLRGWSRLGEGLRREYRLVVAGRYSIPRYCDELVVLTEKLGICKEVVFLGEVPYGRIPYLYKCASAFVFSSMLETFGHPLVEAMAMELPIVAANSTCIPEIVDGAALLFDARDPSQLARDLERVLTDQDLRDDLVSRGASRAAEFSWRKTARMTLAILESAAGES